MVDVDSGDTWHWLVNPSYHNHVAARSTGPQRKDRRRRYSRQINELHAEMMGGASPDPGLKAAHDAFVSAAIKHARMESARKLVQEDLADVVLPASHESARPSVPRATCATPTGQPYDLTAETARALGRAAPAPTIDGFVLRTSRAPPLPVPRKRARRVKKSKHRVDGPGADSTTAGSSGPAEGRGQRIEKAKKRKEAERAREEQH